jgi:hypothetical protein
MNLSTPDNQEKISPHTKKALQISTFFSILKRVLQSDARWECRDATARKSNYLVENLLRLIGNNFDAGVRQRHSIPKHRKVAIFQLVYLFASGITSKNVCLRPAKGFLADARGRTEHYIRSAPQQGTNIYSQPDARARCAFREIKKHQGEIICKSS